MAYNNNNSIKYPSVKGTINFYNTDSELEKSKLYVEYWNGMIKIAISPMIEGTDNQATFPQFDDKAGLAIFIRQAKAHVLMSEISKFLKDPTKFKNVGVRSGDNLILLSSPSEYPKAKNLVLTIIKFVPRSNEIKDMRHYEFKGHYHSAVRNFDVSTSNFDTAYEYDGLEAQEFIMILKAYIEASTSAFSADLIYKDTFERTRYNDKLNAIAKNLGVDISYKSSSPAPATNNTQSTSNNNASYPQYQNNNGRYIMDDDEVPF